MLTSYPICPECGSVNIDSYRRCPVCQATGTQVRPDGSTTPCGCCGGKGMRLVNGFSLTTDCECRACGHRWTVDE